MPSIAERILSSFGAVTRSDLNEQVGEAFQKGYKEAAADYGGDGGEDEPVSGTTAKYGYRRTTRGLRDFTQIDRERIIEIVWTLFQSNPVADRSMEIKRDYILGRGVTFQARSESLQKILEDFWRVNRMDRRVKEFTLQLFLFGVQMYTVFVRNSDGRVRLGYIDPAEIEDVVPHPENAMEMWAVIVKAQTAEEQWQRNLPQRIYRIVREEENMPDKYSDWLKGWNAAGSEQESEDVPGEAVRGLEPFSDEQNSGQDDSDQVTEGKLVTHSQAHLEDWEKSMLKALGKVNEQGEPEYDGACIYVKVNSVSNQPFGYSDLLQVADWLDQQDEALFALADREQWRNYFSWDVTLKGAAEDVVKRRAAEMRNKAPKRGTVNVHNEAEEWRMDYPSLDQAGSIETARALQNHAFGGLGFPEAWFGRGDETNRATLSAQGDPTWRTLEHDQDVVRDMILDILHMVRDQAEIANTWSPEQDQDQNQPQDLDELAGQVAGGVSSNGRLDSDETVSEAGVPDLGAKLSGQIIQGEVPEDQNGEQTEEDETIDLGDIKDVDPREITITMPEMTARDLSMVASMLSTVASALVVAEEQGWQDKAKSVEAWGKALSEFGIELDVAAVQQALERKEQEQEQYGERDPLAGTAMARHGVMLPTDDEEVPMEWDRMRQDQREALVEAVMDAVGVERVPEELITWASGLPEAEL